MKTGEEIFIERINQKEIGAYHELFSDFYRSLVLFAVRYVGEQGEAEDIVQDLFVAIWEKEEQFLSYNSFRVFLYHSVRNTCLNRIKHRKVKEKYVDYNILHAERTQGEDFDMMEEELYRLLFKTIQELPTRCREVFLLHLDGKKNEEIAQELNITLLTVKTQKKRAIRHIRDRLGDLGVLLLTIMGHHF